MLDRLEKMKEALMNATEMQICGNLNEADTEELGEAVDMIKDLAEAAYYCKIVEAMDEKGKHENSPMMYYPPMPQEKMYYPEESYYNRRSYYNGGGGNSSSSMGNNGGGNSNSGNGGSSSQYSEREYPYEFRDFREGKSPRSRRMYMEAKETHQDKAAQMKELEKYMQELTQDIVEMIEGSTQEEKQYLSKRVAALANKLTQLND